MHVHLNVASGADPLGDREVSDIQQLVRVELTNALQEPSLVGNDAAIRDPERAKSVAGQASIDPKDHGFEGFATIAISFVTGLAASYTRTALDQAWKHRIAPALKRAYPDRFRNDPTQFELSDQDNADDNSEPS